MAEETTPEEGMSGIPPRPNAFLSQLDSLKKRLQAIAEKETFPLGQPIRLEEVAHLHHYLREKLGGYVRIRPLTDDKPGVYGEFYLDLDHSRIKPIPLPPYITFTATRREGLIREVRCTPQLKRTSEETELIDKLRDAVVSYKK